MNKKLPSKRPGLVGLKNEGIFFSNNLIQYSE